jgi:GcvH upstream region-like protein
MLNFFRKHQRLFFIITSVVIILSFSFFGTFNAMAPAEKVSDRQIAKAIDGSPISEREVEALVRFLSSAYEDRGLSKRMPNVLNDSFICKDFLLSGIGVMLAEQYFEEIKPELEERLKKTKHYRPYRHPHAPFLGAEIVWEQFNPNINHHLTELKEKSEEATPANFALLCNLYLDQAQFHPEVLKRLLMYQQNQYSWMPQDPRLSYENFALFGFESLEDWVGRRFLEIAAQFLINGSIIAEQKGYRVSLEEARSELYQNAQTGLQRLAEKKELSQADVGDYIKNEIRALGIDEPTTVKIWRKAMLFRRLFHDVGNAVLLDHLAHQQFHSFANETASLDVYQLPDHLKFRDFRTMLKFQIYIDAISTLAKSRNNPLDLPNNFLKPEELEKRIPSLVKRRFLLEFSETEREEIALRTSLRETWDWQLKDENWDKLKNEFPILAGDKADTREGKFLILDKLDQQSRLRIDQFTRDQIIESHPEWIAQELEKQPVQTATVGIRLKGGISPFEGMEDSTHLLELLQVAPIKDQIDHSEAALAAQNKLEQFTANGKKYYKISVVKRGIQKEIVSFEEVNADGTLDSLLDKKLQEAYSEVRKKDSGVFQESDGSWKPFDHVKDQIALKVYADLLKAIEDDARKSGALLESPSSDFYAPRRLASYVRDAKRQIEKNLDDPHFVKLAEANSEQHLFADEPSLETQWLLIKTHQEVSRAAGSSFTKQGIFESPIGLWSPIDVGASGEMAFFHLLNRTQADTADLDKIAEGQQVLSIDARRLLTHQLLNQIREKKAIGLSTAQRSDDGSG